MNLESMEKKIFQGTGEFTYKLLTVPFEKLYDEHKTFKDLIAITPKDEEELQHLAKIYDEQGELENALRSYSMLLFINPSYMPTVIRLGAIYFKLKNYNQALAVFMLANLMFPSHPSPLLFMGECYLHLNDKSKARLSFEKSVEAAIQLNDAKYRDIENLARNLAKAI